MNKKEAENRIQAIEKEAGELRKLINEPEVKEYEPKHGDYGYDCDADPRFQVHLANTSGVIECSRCQLVEHSHFPIVTKVGNIIDDLEAIRKPAPKDLFKIKLTYDSNRCWGDCLEIDNSDESIYLSYEGLEKFILALRQHLYQMEKNNE